MKYCLNKKRIEFYLSLVIVSSIILSLLALFALVQQYSFVNKIIDKINIPEAEVNWFSSLNTISAFSFFMIVFSLFVILVVSSYLSTRDVQKQIEITKLKSDFISTVSHELKTPLTSIRLLTERLLKLDPYEIDKQRDYHHLIFTQTCRLNNLIDNILDFSKLGEEEKQICKIELVNLSELVKKIIDEYPVKVIKPDCKIEINIDVNLDDVYLDKEAISRAFINLLDNALKFSPTGGVVKVNLGNSGKNEVFIEVSDQGPGIEEKEKEKIFERFYHTGKGTGLGLAIVKNSVNRHNGRVELESEIGKGSLFRLVFPMKNKF